MGDRYLNSSAIIAVIAVTLGALTLSFMRHQEVAQSMAVSQAKQRQLRERALTQDIEIDGVSESHSEYSTFDELINEAQAIVYGRIVNSYSFFDESGNSNENGEVITTEYTVEVHQVLRNRPPTSAAPAEKLAPAPLATPLKIARNGGVVLINGHRASVKVKGYENLVVGRNYIFFLFWSPDYKAYVLAGGISGAVLVNDDMSLKSLASSRQMQARVKSLRLETLISQID